MRYASVRDFKLNATKYLKRREEVYITRRGKPVAVLSPVRPKSPEAAMIEMGRLVQEAGFSRRQVLDLLDEARKDVYRR